MTRAMNTGRAYSTGSITDRDGGVRAYLHIKRLRELAGSVEVHCRHDPMLLAAAEAMEELARKNKRLGRELGAKLRRCVVEKKGASLPVWDAGTPEKIADLAAEGPVTVYVWRDPRRLRVTRRTTLPKGSRYVGRFDEGTDYREIQARVRDLVEAPSP